MDGVIGCEDEDSQTLLAAAVQEATGEHVTLAFVDQGYTGPEPTAAAQAEGIELQVVKLPTARQGFVLLPKRWVVERSFAWASRSSPLAARAEWQERERTQRERLA